MAPNPAGSCGRPADAHGSASSLPRTALPEPGSRPRALCPPSPHDVAAWLRHRAPASPGRPASDPPGPLRLRLRPDPPTRWRLGGGPYHRWRPVGWLDRGLRPMQRARQAGSGWGEGSRRVPDLLLPDPGAHSFAEPGFANLVRRARAITSAAARHAALFLASPDREKDAAGARRHYGWIVSKLARPRRLLPDSPTITA